MGEGPIPGSTPEQAFDNGKYYYNRGEYYTARECFDHAYYNSDDSDFTEECRRYIDLCDQKIEKEEKLAEEAEQEFRTGVNYFNIASRDRNYSTFQTAIYCFGRAANKAPTEEFKRECDDYIKECEEWMDSIKFGD